MIKISDGSDDWVKNRVAEAGKKRGGKEVVNALAQLDKVGSSEPAQEGSVRLERKMGNSSFGCRFGSCL